MNPFRWTGPEFLAFYVVFAVAIVGAFAVRFRWWGAGSDVPVDNLTTDPYRIAFLRGGIEEAVRVAVFNLVDRGILDHDLDEVSVARADAAQLVRRRLDRALLAHFARSRSVKAAEQDREVRASCEEYERQLAERGFLPDDREKGRRFALAVVAVGLVAGVALARIVVAASVGRHDFALLIFLCAIAIAALVHAYRYQRTARGTRALSNVAALLSRLKAGVGRIKPGGATNEALLLASVFGLHALPSLAFPVVDIIFPRPKIADIEVVFDSGGSDGGCGGGCGGCGGD